MLDREKFVLKEHCHVASNTDGDRFVGVKADSTDVRIYFPLGYQLPDDDQELKKDVKNLFTVLASFTDKKDRILHMDKFTAPQSVDFPIQAYMNIINYYLDHNGSYYTETESTYKIDKKGKKDWGKTIKKVTPVIQGKNLVYLNSVVRQNTPNYNHLITAINKFCVYESFERIGWLYTNNTPEKALKPQAERAMLMILNDKYNNTNNDVDKLLFSSMKAMIEYIDNQTIDNQFYFGTDNFEYVWQALIDLVFGVENKNDYFPHGKWVERYGTNKGKPSSALEPDSIMIYKDKYYVLDAKYYRYGVYPEEGAKLLPKSADINKQITYAEFVKNNKTPKDANVYNAFIMPYNKYDNKFLIDDIIANVAEATGDWVPDPKDYDKIQGIVIDTRYLLKSYDGNHDKEKEILSKEIEKYL